MNQPLTPIDVAWTEVDSLPNAQSITGNQPQNRIAAFSDKSCPIWRIEQFLNGFPGDIVRETVQLASKDDWNCVKKISFQIAFKVSKTKETAQS